MNRAERRAQGHRSGHHIQQAIACPDCNSDVEIVKVGPRQYRGEVRHDDTCVWFRAFKQAGGLGIRFGHYADPDNDEGDT